MDESIAHNQIKRRIEKQRRQKDWERHVKKKAELEKSLERWKELYNKIHTDVAKDVAKAQIDRITKELEKMVWE